MRALVSVLKREVADRKVLFLMGAVLSVLSVVTPHLPGVRGDAAEIRQAIALMVTCAFAWGAALVLGATVYVKDLAESKLAFYLSRPISPGAVFGGKLLGALVLIYGASAIVIAPAALLGMGRSLLQGKEGSLLWIVALVAPLLILPVANAVNLAVRSRDSWLAFDLGAAAAGALLLVSAERILRSAGLHGAVPPLAAAALLALVPAATLAGGFLAAARARTDIRHAHRVLSTVVWSVLLPFCALSAAAAWWFVHPSVRSFTEIAGGTLTPDGGWVHVQGEMRFRGEIPFGFLVDTRNPSRSIPLDIEGPWWSEVALSADGTRAAWVSLADGGVPVFGGISRLTKVDVQTARLDSKSPRRERTTISATGAARLALSSDGKRLALVDVGTVSVYELETERTLVAARLPEGGREWLPSFIDGDRVRVAAEWGGFAKEPERRVLPIYELQVSTRQLSRTGELGLPETRWLRAGADEEGKRLLAIAQGGPAYLCDARTGAILATLGSAHGVLGAGFLADGRTAVVLRDGDARSLALFSRAGTSVGAIPLPPSRNYGIAGEPASGMLRLAAISRDDSIHRSALLLDLGSGRVVRDSPGLSPVAPLWFLHPSPVRTGDAASLSVHGSSLVRIDPATGAETRILP